MRRTSTLERAGRAARIAPLLGAFGLAGVASAQSPTATATIGYHDAPVRGFRAGDDFLLPLDAVPSLDWTASRRGDRVRLSAEGRVVDLPVRRYGTSDCLSLKTLAREIGALTDWLPGYDAFEMMASVDAVTAQRGAVSVSARFAVRPRFQVLSDPARVVVDIDGARVSSITQQNVESGVKVVQFRPNSVRVVYETSFFPVLPRLAPGPGATFSVDFTPRPAPPVAPSVDPRGNADPRERATASQAPPFLVVAPLDLRLGVELESPTATLLSLGTPTAALKTKPTIRKPQPDVLELLLPGLQARFPEGMPFDSKAVTSATSEIVGKDTLVRLQLAVPMGGEVWSDASGVSIQLLRPAIADGKIAGKVIVIDAGHGGKDSGCKFGGLTEKSLTLAIAKYASAELASAGVTVLMTRKDDSYPSLTARPDLANRNKADMFISIHINSPGSNSNPSGTEIYYHMQNGVSKLLGECIMAQMQKNAKLPNLGVKSDRILYNSGLAVLRGSKMPAVLVEVGFITNARDRAKMTDAAFQRATARSIAEGVRRFLGIPVD